MKKVGLLAVLVLALVVHNEAYAAKRKRPNAKAISAVCSQIQDVGSASSTIYKNSAPVRASSAHTAPIIGYRREPTLIMGRNNSTKGTKPVYDSSGKQIGSCPWASAIGFAGGRFRCTMQTSSLRRAAVRNTNNPAAYFKINSSLCIKVADAGKCYGSSKGLCNQTLK